MPVQLPIITAFNWYVDVGRYVGVDSITELHIIH